MQRLKVDFRQGWLVSVLTLMVLGFLLSPAMASQSWDETVAAAKGQTVNWYMWGGFPGTNTYVNGFVAERVKALYDVELKQVPVRDISEIVNKLLVEKEAGKTADGSVDLMWINGENFRTAKKNGLLFGPFASELPNSQLVDWESASVKNDFGEPVEGLESPWGSAQVVFHYDVKRTPKPPVSVAELIEWIKANPGRFAYPAPPDFTGSVFIRHIFYHAAGSVDLWQGDYSQEQFDSAAEKTYTLLRELKPFLWRKGATYPENPVRLAHLFADGEVDFAMSYHPAEASKNIKDGLYPDTVRTFVFDEGTIANTHFVAIPINAANKAGAMVVADFLLSPEAQFKKADVNTWGDLPAIEMSRLSPDWQERFKKQDRGVATLDDATLAAHRLPEPPSAILIELEKGWQAEVLKK